jgi:hypothetical protein
MSESYFSERRVKSMLEDKQKEELIEMLLDYIMKELKEYEVDEAIGLAAQADEEQRDYMDRHRDLVE